MFDLPWNILSLARVLGILQSSAGVSLWLLSLQAKKSQEWGGLSWSLQQRIYDPPPEDRWPFLLIWNGDQFFSIASCDQQSFLTHSHISVGLKTIATVRLDLEASFAQTWVARKLVQFPHEALSSSSPWLSGSWGSTCQTLTTPGPDDTLTSTLHWCQELWEVSFICKINSLSDCW